MKRIGIYAGTFDPVHTGHIVFALQAVERANLDAVYFLPERKPRHKQGVEHFGHRVAMLKKAILPHPRFEVLEVDDVSFTIRRTLPALNQKFPHSELVFLFGSDAVLQLPSWEYSDKLLANNELAISIRSSDAINTIQAAVSGWQVLPKTLHIFDSSAPEIASSNIREALRSNQDAPGALSSVKRYSNQNWLYVSMSQ